VQPTTLASGNTPVSAEPSVTPATDFGRAAKAILVAMVLLIVALTGILIETTWRSPDGQVEVLPQSSDPGSFAHR
jgi:hypothetical protein